MRIPPALHLIAPLFLSVFFLAACVPSPATPEAGAGSRAEQLISISPGKALFSLFITNSDTDAPAVVATIASVELHDSTGWTAVLSLNRSLILNETNRMQELLLIDSLAPSNYDRIRLSVDELSLLDNAGQRQTVIGSPRVIELALPENFQLEGKDHGSVFLVLNSRRMQPGDPSSLSLHAFGEDLSLNRDLLFVSCPDLDTVWAVRTDTNRVSRSYRIDGKPIYIGVTPDGQKLVVLLKDRPSLQVIEISSGRTLDLIRLISLRQPLFMTLSSDGASAYVLGDYNQVLRCDLQTGLVAAQNRIGQDLQYALYLQEEGQVAVTSGQTQKVLFLDGASLQEISAVETGRQPAGLAFSGKTLYVAVQGTRNIGSLDLSGNGFKNRPLGLAPNRIQVAGDFLFAGGPDDSSLVSLHLPFLSNAKNLAMAGNVGEMTFSEARKWLYVGSPSHSLLSVVDVSSRNRPFAISLGSPSLGLAVMP